MADSISKEIKAVIDAMEDKKGLDITVLDISSVSDITDHFIICSGTNRSQIQALSDGVEEDLAKKGLFHKGIEGFAG